MSSPNRRMGRTVSFVWFALFALGGCAHTKPSLISSPACGGSRINLTETLAQAACEVPDTKVPAAQPMGRDQLELRITSSKMKIAPGGHVDLDVSFVNKADGPLPLTFIVDPLPRFAIEVYDEKGRRVDLPKGDPRKKNAPPPPKLEAHAAEVTLDRHGAGHVLLGWDANRLRWAPEKARGMAIGADFPRTSAGPLPKGRYTLRVLSSLNAVATAPTLTIDVRR